MSRKDYQSIAAALARTRPHIAQYTRTSAVGNNTMVDHISLDAAVDAWIAARNAIAYSLSDDNPRFDTVRFVRATEV